MTLRRAKVEVEWFGGDDQAAVDLISALFDALMDDLDSVVSDVSVSGTLDCDAKWPDPDLRRWHR